MCRAGGATRRRSSWEESHFYVYVAAAERVPYCSAYGVGVGNAVHVVDETADLADAASAILTAKTFDYATSCLADNALVVHADVYDELPGG